MSKKETLESLREEHRRLCDKKADLYRKGSLRGIAGINQNLDLLRSKIDMMVYSGPESNNLLNRSQLGELIFQQIKTDLKSRGYSMTNRNFPADYPISRRAVYLIRRGVFTVDTLNKLPGVKVEEWFRVGDSNSTTLSDTTTVTIKTGQEQMSEYKFTAHIKGY